MSDDWSSESVGAVLQYFLSYELDEENKMINFSSNESGKTYTLVESVEKFAVFVDEILYLTLNGSFVMTGEEPGDIKKVIIENNIVSVKEATISFD